MIVNIGSKNSGILKTVQRLGGKILRSDLTVPDITHVLVLFGNQTSQSAQRITEMIEHDLNLSSSSYFMDAQGEFSRKVRHGGLIGELPQRKQISAQRTGFITHEVTVEVSQVDEFFSEVAYFATRKTIRSWTKREIIEISGNCQYQFSSPAPPITRRHEVYFVISAKYSRSTEEPVDSEGRLEVETDAGESYSLPIHVKWTGIKSAMPTWVPSRLDFMVEAGQDFKEEVELQNNNNTAIRIASSSMRTIGNGGTFGFKPVDTPGFPEMQAGASWIYEVSGHKREPSYTVLECWVVLSDGKRAVLPVTVDSTEIPTT